MIGWVILLLIIVIGLYWFVIRKTFLKLSKGQYMTLPATKDVFIFNNNTPFTIKAIFTPGADFDNAILVSKYNGHVVCNWYFVIRKDGIGFLREAFPFEVSIPCKILPNIKYTVTASYDGKNMNFVVMSANDLVSGSVPSPGPMVQPGGTEIMVGGTFYENKPVGLASSLDIQSLQIVDDSTKSSLTWNFPDLKAVETSDTFVMGQAL
jgi:hypothetical protein